MNYCRSLPVIILFCLMLSGCASPHTITEEPTVASAATNTPTPASTSTPTITPQPTRTPTTEPTPTATIAPSKVILDLFEGVNIDYIDHFDSIHNWSAWPDERVRWIENGAMKLINVGKEGGFSGFKLYTFEEGNGTIFRFKYQRSRDHFYYGFVSGEFDTDPYKEFGVSTLDGILNAYLFKGKQWSPLLSFSGGGQLPLQQDTWYNVVDAVGYGGTFFTAIWDNEEPAHIASKYFDGRGTKGWEGQTWSFSTCAGRRAILYIDDFAVFSFKDLKVKK